MFTVSSKLFASSATTSEVIDCRDAFDLSLSLYTSAGTTSVITYQISNYTGPVTETILEASWSDWTVFTPSAATYVAPPLNVRYARLLKGETGTFVVTYNKQVSP